MNVYLIHAKLSGRPHTLFARYSGLDLAKVLKGADRRSMAQIALHCANYGKGAIRGIQRHNRRETENHSNKEIDISRSDLNWAIFDTKDANKSYYQYIMSRCDERTNNKRAIRSDANILTEFVFSSSHEYMVSLNPEELARLMKCVSDYLVDAFVIKNAVYSVVHMDEYTPHLHFGFVPMTEEDRLSAKALITRELLRHLQAALPSHLAEQGFDLSRGQEGSKKRHLEPAEYKAACDRDLKELVREYDLLVYKYKQVQEKYDELTRPVTVQERLKWAEEISVGRNTLNEIKAIFDANPKLWDEYHKGQQKIQNQRHDFGFDR